jgi:1-acyl-sn-glycerol-3-phosphate acyltransferase
VLVADEFTENAQHQLRPYLKKIIDRVDEEKVFGISKLIQDHLPLFLDEEDYTLLDSITNPRNIRETLYRNYRQLLSPSGILTKDILARDPLGLSFLSLRKLQHLQYDENYELYDNYIITKDHRHIILFLEPLNRASETKENGHLIDELEKLCSQLNLKYPKIKLSFFGAHAVAVGNARQLQRDTMLTVTIMIVLLLVILLGFFKRKRIPFLILVPVAFGGLFALCCVELIQGTLSVLALAVGAIILGVAVDYALHYIVLSKYHNNPEEVISELATPLTIGSATTVLAFLCLQFANASVLRDIGLFAGLSLIGAALCSLVVMPHMIGEHLFVKTREAKLEKWLKSSGKQSGYVVVIVLILTPFFLYLAPKVKFNNDLSTLNFMRPETREAQQRLESLNKAALTSVYVVSSAADLHTALRRNERVLPLIEALKKDKVVGKVSGVSDFLISDSLQQLRLQRWKAFWSPEKRSMLSELVHQYGKELKFSSTVLDNFDTMTLAAYKPLTLPLMDSLKEFFFKDFIIQKDNRASVITLLQVYPQDKDKVYHVLEGTDVSAFDRQMVTNVFVNFVQQDFNYIVTFTSVLVFIALLIVYGRIEITLITFVPMLFTWIWILGLMALFGIEFNIVNVMVSTFIFGLGDDYSIFMMDGLQQAYATGRKTLPAVQTSIFLSAITTISGLGVLIFAKHPALTSIAGISIIGVSCVFVMARSIEPFFFQWLVTSRTSKGLMPITFIGIIQTGYTYLFFIIGSALLTVIGIVFRIIPFGKSKVDYAFHKLIRFFTWMLVHTTWGVKKELIGFSADTFSRPQILISNHTSFLDILFLIKLHPKLILLTNKWVYNSPIFGGVVRLASYFPVTEGVDESIDHLKKLTDQGYSIVVFPEGTRSEDGKLKRFHKGAFYLAEQLKLPIRPVVIHGLSSVVPKGKIYVQEGKGTLKFLPLIEPDDFTFGASYSERAKNISRYFKSSYALLKSEQETPAYFRPFLFSNYIYKGPVLEWYLRIKLNLENNYKTFHELIPLKGRIIDLGCGYGFLSYMLQFLSEERTVIGVDYDERKLSIAANGYLRSERLHFYCADVTRYVLDECNVIIISDVLHYLHPDHQQQLIVNCFHALLPGGRLIIRDGNVDLQERHKGTKVTEFFSVKLLKFNKSNGKLSFVSGEFIKHLASLHNMKVNVLDESRLTSNVMFVIDKPM